MSDFQLLQSESLRKARAKHAPMNSRHEAYAVIKEEFEEFWEQVKNGGADTPEVDNQKVLKELIHTAAMCQRAAEDLSLVPVSDTAPSAPDAERLRLRESLQEYQRFNRIRNDLDAYLHELGEWALGNISDKPTLEYFGLSDLAPTSGKGASE